ncbi:MAG: hypothetical protein AAFQ82_08870 [Myxococcota bacterium]
MQFLRAHNETFPGLEVLVADIDSERAQGFAAEHHAKLVSTEEAAGCDIVCVATPSRTPVIHFDMIKPGAHINAMGADAPGKQELDVEILQSARVFVDEIEQARHSGEINVALERGVYSLGDISGTVGQVIAGRVPARFDDTDITVFDSTGLAVQDLALASRIYSGAGETGARLDIVGVTAG